MNGRGLAFALVVVCGACGATRDDTPDAVPTPVRSPPAPLPSEPPAPPVAPYPTGPYGSSLGDTLADFTVRGYAMSRSQRDSRALPFRDISLSEVRADPACTCLVVMWGAAGNGCVPSIRADATLAQAVAKDPSLCVIEPIFANGDEPPPSPFDVAAYPTRADLDTYTQGQRESYPVGLATPSAYRALDGWTLVAHPLNFIVRPSDMRVLGFLVGGTGDLVTNIQALCHAPQAVETLAVGLAPRRIVVDADHVYASDIAAGVVRVPSAGGAVEPLARPASTPDAIAVDGANVYWATHDGGASGASFELGRVAKDGGTPVVLASSASGYVAMTIDATDVWYARADGEIGHVPIAGGAAQAFASGVDAPTSVAVDDTHVYWTAANGLVVAPRVGGAPAPLAIAWPLHIVTSPVEVAVHGGNVYVRAVSAEGAVLGQLQLDGTVVATLTGGSFPSLTIGPTGTVMAALGHPTTTRGAMIGAFEGGGMAFVTPGQRDVVAVTSDGTYAYWASSGATGALRRMRR